MSADARRRISQRINLTEEEFALWNAVSRKMFVPLRSDGVILQFQGYDELEEFPRTANDELDREFLKEVLYKQDGAPNQYKVAKQADVLMLFYVLAPVELKRIFERLGYSYRFASIAINSKYYVPRTVNDSTLSRVAHAWVLSRLDWLNSWRLLSSAVAEKTVAAQAPPTDAWDIFYEALGSDFFDVAARGTAKTGIHMGAMAGTLDIVQRSYSGLTILGDVLWIEPQLPAALNLLFFKLYFRNQSLSFQITRDSATITSQLSKAKPIKIGYRTQIYEVSPGDTIEIPLHARAA
jgi:alpha,alpha-trehalase